MLRFRESFRGYNRDDVNAYIEQINIHFSKKEAELRAVIADLENRTVTPTQLHTDSEYDDLNRQLISLKNENETLKNELAKAKENIENDAEEKSRLYVSMSAQVGSIIIQANSNAEKIISEAKLEAENIKMTAALKSKEILDEAQKKKEETIRCIEETLKTASNECITEYAEIINDAGNKLTLISDSIRIKAEIMLTSLESKSAAIKGE